MIGIVVPAHNEAELIDTCLRSIAIAAAHPDLCGEAVEIVVVLDHLAGDDAALGPLRRAAAVGDVDAAVQVTRRLLDRSDADGSTDQLYEATIWIDRFHGTETMARSQQIERVSLNYCNQKVLHYHWLC